jgi:hypothetical protein
MTRSMPQLATQGLGAHPNGKALPHPCSNPVWDVNFLWIAFCVARARVCVHVPVCHMGCLLGQRAVIDRFGHNAGPEGVHGSGGTPRDSGSSERRRRRG